MYAYPFSGHWQDVGTISSLWEANMDLLGEKPTFNLKEPSWRIYSRNSTEPPHYAGENSAIVNSLITEGCEIYGRVENSVLSNGVTVEEGAVVKDSVIMKGTVIKAGAVVNYTVMDGDTVVGSGCSIGGDKQNGEITLVGGGLSIPDGTVIEPGKMINESSLKELTEKEDV